MSGVFYVADEGDEQEMSMIKYYQIRPDNVGALYAEKEKL